MKNISKPIADFLELTDPNPDVMLSGGAYLKFIQEDTEEELEITDLDIQRVLASEASVREFFEALGSRFEVEIFGVNVPSNLMTIIEEYASYVEQV
jgi:hypothetical protein